MTTPNVILGIDPGPRDWSWVVYDTQPPNGIAFGHENMVSWEMQAPYGEVVVSETTRRQHSTEDSHASRMVDLVAIEDFTYYGTRVGKAGLDTCKTIGFLQAYFEYKGLPVILISRQKVSAVICGQVAEGSRRINTRMRELVSSLHGRKKGLTGHMRAAAAVAYVAPGVYAEQRLVKGITNDHT